MARKEITVVYREKTMNLIGVARLAGCDPKVVYRYYDKHGTIDGFDEWRDNKFMHIDFKGERITIREAAERLGAPPQSVRDYWRNHGTLEGFHRGRKGYPVKHLQKFYHTLDDSIPLDRCIAAAGYRSIRQFCQANDLSESLVGCWRRGKLYMYAGRLDYLDPQFRHPTLLDEMTNFQHGISTPLYRIMVGTGCLEWELFPDVFTKDFYNGVYEELQADSPPRMTKDTTIERRERRRVVRAVLRTLPDREREVVELTFGIGPTKEELTYDAIGRRMGCTRERTRQYLIRAMRWLMHPSRIKTLAEVSPFPTADAVERDRTAYDAMRELWTLKGLPYRRSLP